MKFLGRWFVLMACFGGLVSRSVGEDTEVRRHKFDREIEAMLAADRTNPPVVGGIVFAGSSSFRVWKTLAKDLAGYPVVNRGFGSSEMSDLNRYMRQIVVPLKPRVVVVYEGDNDLAGGKEMGVVLDDIRLFVGMMEASLPRTRILFLAVKPSPSRRSLLEKQQLFNRRLKEYVARNPRLGFVDVATPMLDARGEPREELFQSDRLHMKPEGYALWVRELRPALRELLEAR
jgi:lysophospholipase L1-like esterase